ncbi:hypothetical protein ZWY2020_052888 [Hordeum vulgare]|nr:hypothetical protein ZWY2020_052888 [Hordeum vulgare]
MAVVAPSSTAKSSTRGDAGKSLSSASTAVFQLQGAVYPIGHYYVTMNIGDPAKPYFLDVDTGSDLTWLQCDAPCQSCNKVPHPWYKPTKNKIVPCAASLCTSLTPNKKICDMISKWKRMAECRRDGRLFGLGKGSIACSRSSSSSSKLVSASHLKKFRTPVCLFAGKGRRYSNSVSEVKNDFKSLFLSFGKQNLAMEILLKTTSLSLNMGMCA